MDEDLAKLEGKKEGWSFTPIERVNGRDDEFRLKVGTVVGMTDGWWSQVHHFYPAEEGKLNLRGEMVAIVCFKVTGATDMDVMAIGREVLGRLNEQYYGVEAGTVWERLQAALEQVRTEVSDPEKVFGLAMTGGGKGAEGPKIAVEQLEIACGVLWRGAWYVAGWGGGGVWISRGGEEGQILMGESRSVWGGSGYVKDGDVFLVGNKRFFDLVGGGVIKVALSSGSQEEAVGILSPAVRGKGDSRGAAAAVVAVEKLPEVRSVAETVAESVQKEEEVSGGGRKMGVMERMSGLKRRLSWPVRRFGLGKGPTGVFGRDIYIKSYRPPGIGRRGTMALGVVLLMVILGSLIAGVRIQRDRELAAGPGAQTERLLGEARDLAAVDPEQAKRAVVEAKVLVTTVADAKSREQLQGEIASLSDQLAGVKRVAPTTFMDLKLVRDGLSVEDSAFDSNTWWGLDTSGQRLVKMDMASKQADVVASQDKIGNGSKVTATAGLAYVFGAQGIAEVDTTNGKERIVEPRDKDLGQVVDIGNFGGNLYVLDSGGGMIWRYPAIEGGFGGKQQWLTDGKVNFSGAVGMVIDGSIWVGIKDGTILKFTQGAADSFILPQLDQPIGSLADVFTTADTRNLYLLDTGLGRVIVVSKSGSYVNEYVAAELKRATNIAVDESGEKAIYATAGDKVLEIKL